MGSYMAVVSLIEELQQHLSPNNRIFRSSGPFTKTEIQILHDAVTSMNSLLTDSSGLTYNHHFITQISENRIVSLAHKAGNYLDFWTAEYLEDTKHWNWTKAIRASPSLAEFTQEMIAINQELNEIHRSSSTERVQAASGCTGVCLFDKRADKSSTCLSDLSPLTTTVSTGATLIGLENEFIAMLDCLTGHPSKLKVFPIIGMAGIGKTTFSNKLYHNPLVVHHFYVRAWVTVSQQYQVRKILLSILNCVANEDLYEFQGRCEEELGEKVYRILKHKRYLLVLDDMWDTKAWDYLKRVFPDDKNGSRVILTSRLREVAINASEDTPPHYLRCLDIHESWELLSSKIFVDESCPQELVEIGKQIAYKCHGLPLTVVLIGGLLSKMSKKLDVWEAVAQSVGSLVMEEVELCKHILSLSYNHLPDSLKQCFLYMGMFPEDYEISVKKLTWLWVAEGFIRSTNLKSLEEVAEDYLADLISRSLILVKRKGTHGTVKTCYIHDLMRELCLRESQKHNFLLAINSYGQLPLHDEDLSEYDLPPNFGGKKKIPPRYLHDLRRLSFHSSIHEYSNKASFPYTRSLMSFEKLSVSAHRHFLVMSLKLLKVLNIININIKEIPREIWILTQLKFLALTVQRPLNVKHLSTFSLLQTIVIDCEWNGYLTSTFWDMLELRHFHLKRSCQSYLSTHSRSSQSYSPFLSAREQETLPLSVLNNLISLSTIRPISCTEKTLRSMPHLKSLGVHESEEDYQFRGWFERLVILPELEKLKYVFGNPFVSSVLKPGRLPPWQFFPQS